MTQHDATFMKLVVENYIDVYDLWAFHTNVLGAPESQDVSVIAELAM